MSESSGIVWMAGPSAGEPLTQTWQILTCSPQLCEKTERLRLEDGWLYRSIIGSAITLEFVRDSS